MVAYLGLVEEKRRRGVKPAAEGKSDNSQTTLFEVEEPELVEVDTKRGQVENSCAFGGPWFGLEWVRRLGLNCFLSQTIPDGREEMQQTRIMGMPGQL